jgi:hypothetical protein
MRSSLLSVTAAMALLLGACAVGPSYIKPQEAVAAGYVNSRAAAATSLIAVYKALGGGWQGAPLPGPGGNRLTSTTSPGRR